MSDSAMSSPTSVPPEASPEKPAGFFQNLLDVYFSPSEAFGRIVRRPAWILPTAVYVVVTLAFTAVWINRVDMREFMRAQIEQSPQASRLSSEQREQAVEQQARFVPVFAWVGAVLGPLVGLVVVSAALLFVYRFFYAAEVRFTQSLAIGAWTFLPVGLVSTALILTVLSLKGDWNINPQEALEANLSLLLDRSTAPKPLWSLLSSIDLFSLWTVFLLATGYAAAMRRKTGAVIWGVAVPWAIIVLVKMGWAAIF